MPAPLVRPEFGPTLAALVRRRLGVAERTTVLAALALGIAAVAIMLVARWVETPDGEVVVHRGDPVFNLVYSPDALSRVTPRPGELIRLEARRGALRMSVVARALRLPEYRGDVSRGLLPVYAEGYADELRRSLPGFRLTDEGKARVNDFPGYQLGFRAGPPGRRIKGRDLLLVEQELGPRMAVAVSLRQTGARRVPGEAEQRVIDLTKDAFRSVAFGTDPA